MTEKNWFTEVQEGGDAIAAFIDNQLGERRDRTAAGLAALMTFDPDNPDATPDPPAAA